ncbi:MAG: ATP-binding protein, partial [Planctomycetes bacterium]|nr:ATP-binding protein [Planctomycetota bacterium]
MPMKYAELVDFDPIESVVELRAADKTDQAKRLVQTFVISDRMAELLRTVVFPQLQFATPTDNKGLLVVGNYGTGKSHLMAIISAVAEHRELAAELTNPAVADAAKEATGRFQVIRAEAPSTQLPLRDLICQRIE